MQRLSYAKEEIKHKVHIKQLIEDTLGTKFKKGAVPCPFHSEKEGSLRIKDDFFYCFGCGAGGDVITFTMKYHGLKFKDAINWIDSRYGLGLTDQKVTVSQQVAIRERQKELERQQYIEARQKREYGELAQRHWVAHVAVLYLEPLSDLWCHYYNELQKLQLAIEKGGY